MANRFIKLLSMFLAVVLLVNMLPLGIMAQDLQNSLSANTTVTETVDEADIANAQIVAEIPEKRTEYSKEFLLSSGLRMAVMYAEPVHYQTDNGWEDIDNTLKTKDDGTYTNTAGIWDVSFPQELTKDESITIQKDGYTLSFYMAGELNSDGNAMLMSGNDTAMMPMAVTDVEQATAVIQAPDLTAMKDAADFEETVLEKVQSQIAYADVFENTDVIYNLDSNKVKESLILQSYSDTLRGYQYTLEIGEMNPVLAEDGTITFYDRTGKNVVMVMPAPFLVDNNGNYCNDIQVVLEGDNGTYTMTYLLPVQWLGAQDRAWPVVLDPAVQPALIRSNIRDKTVMTKNQSSHTNNWNRNGVGRSADYGIMRTYLKYRNLPQLTSSDVVIDAVVTMRKPSTGNVVAAVEVHKVIGTWESEDIVWADQDDPNDSVKIDPNIEDYAMANELGTYTWRITDIVRDWYSGENTGMVFKLSDAIENGDQNIYKLFYSSDSSENDDYQPTLTIYYRNNNGLEDHWDYTSASAGRAGEGFVNNFTGNLIWVRNGLGFEGCIMPVFISHVYNLNDSTSLSNSNNSNQTAGNFFGMGNGWRINYNQRIYQWSLNDSYYVWEDEDGTDHYFEEFEENVYVDEDDIEITLTIDESAVEKYKLTNQQGETLCFDSNGRLTRIENNQKQKSAVTITYVDENSQKIETIKDSANREYHFTYNENGLLTNISYYGTGSNVLQEIIYQYDANDNLIAVSEAYDEESAKGYLCTYEYSEEAIIYNDNTEDPDLRYSHVLTGVTDSTGYKLSYSYYRPVEKYQPYRVQSVTETDGTTQGGSITIVYGHNQTTFTDHKGHTEVHQFNDFGNTTCIQDNQGRAEFYEYAFSTDTEKNTNTDPNKKSNQLTLESDLQYSVGNLMINNGMRSASKWDSIGDLLNFSIVGDKCSTDNKSLLIEHFVTEETEDEEYGARYKTPFVVQPGQTQTFSCDITSATANVFLRATDGTTTVESQPLETSTSWQRQQVSYTNNSDQPVSVTYSVVARNGVKFNLDCPQLELAPTASRYNMINDGDFSATNVWTKKNFGTGDGYISLDVPVLPQFNNKVLKINGDTEKQKSVTQTVYTNGKAGDSLTFGGWAKGNSAPLDSFDTRIRKFGIECYIIYKDASNGQSDPVSVSFNSDSNEWQYASGNIVAEHDFYQICISVVYDYNVNSAMFDGIQMYKQALGSTLQYEELEDGKNKITVSDSDNNQAVYTFDSSDNLIEETVSDDSSQNYEYDEYNNLTLSRTDEGLVYTYAYDDWGNCISTTVSDGTSTMVSTATYSNDGNLLLSSVDVAGKETKYGYNAQTGLLEWVQYPEDTEATRTYYTYDELYRNIKTNVTTDTGLAMFTDYTYANDQLTGITTPSTTYGFKYNSFGQETEVAAGEQTLVKYIYGNDPSRDLLCLEYGNDYVIEYTYDEDGRLIAETYRLKEDTEKLSAETVTYTYDNAGEIATVTDSATGITSQTLYDAIDRPVRYLEEGGTHDLLVRYRYDSENRVKYILYMVDNNLASKAHNSEYAYDNDNRITSYRKGNGILAYTYDKFDRIASTQLTHKENSILNTEYTFYTHGENQTSYHVSAIAHTYTEGNANYTYTYDDNGNILSVNDGTNTTSYVYDSQNQLIRENNQAGAFTHTWTYDPAGNILTRCEYAYTTGSLDGLPSEEFKYVYLSNLADAENKEDISTDNAWGDTLLSYNGHAITYDAIGNPLTDGTWNYTWKNGRELVSMTDGTETWNFTYKADGLRTQRTNGTKTYDYVYCGNQLMYMQVDGKDLLFSYTPEGVPMGITYLGTAYYYLTNLQGDVVGILNNQGELIVSYSYDAWGNILATQVYGSGTNRTKYQALANYNPLRYRGYVYDSEIGLYYLQSRYYNSSTGRFVNIDIFVTTGQGFTGNNMLAYCLNNPVNMLDDEGNLPRWIIVGVVHLAVNGTRSWGKYYIAKTAIATAGNAYLSHKGYKLAKAMFNHGMYGNGRKPSSSIYKLMVSRLLSSNIMSNKISQTIKSAKGNSINKTVSVEFTPTNKINADLYYSLQHVKITIKGQKRRGAWDLKITVSDTYDFDNIRSFSKLSFGNAANDLGWAMQRIGMMTPYKFSVSYTVRW